LLDFGYVSTDGSLPDLEDLASANVIAFDTETSGTNIATDIPYGFSLSTDPTAAYYTSMSNRMLMDVVANEHTLKVAHNAKFDRAMLKKYGIEVNNLACTMVAAHLLEESGLSLEVLLKRYLKGYDMDVKFFKDFHGDIAHTSLQDMAAHFGPHSAACLALWNTMQRDMRANMVSNVFWKIEMPVVPVLCDMEMQGAHINIDTLTKLGESYDLRIDTLNESLCHYSDRTGVNFNSADQAAEVLYDQFKVPKPPAHMKKLWTQSGRPTVDKTYLEQFKERFPIIALYLRYKFFRHLKDTYVDGILKRLVESRIHTNFNQTRTRTGRLSSTDPNLQNIPMRDPEGKRIRKAFDAREGYCIVKADMNQVELRKAACLANCKAMLDAFREGRDIHTETAVRAYRDAERRRDGKTLNFKLVYGGGTEEEQKALFEAYPEVKKWSDDMLQEFEMFGYATTHYGRVRHLGNFDRMGAKERAHAHREGLSTMNQGSCAEYLKIGMRKIWEEIKGSDIMMELQVHDELVFECPNKMLPDLMDCVQRNMTYNELQIPLTAAISVGPNWADQVELIK